MVLQTASPARLAYKLGKSVTLKCKPVIKLQNQLSIWVGRRSVVATGAASDSTGGNAVTSTAKGVFEHTESRILDQPQWSGDEYVSTGTDCFPVCMRCHGMSKQHSFAA
jgi:hypothetical protein